MEAQDLPKPMSGEMIGFLLCFWHTLEGMYLCASGSIRIAKTLSRHTSHSLSLLQWAPYSGLFKSVTDAVIWSLHFPSKLFLTTVAYESPIDYVASLYQVLQSLGLLLIWLVTIVHPPDYIATCFFIKLQKAKEMDLCSPTAGPHPERSKTCSYCWDDMVATTRLTVHSTCKNTFHTQCLEKWFKLADTGKELCPICRGPLSELGIIIAPDGERGNYWSPARLKIVSRRIWWLYFGWLVVTIVVVLSHGYPSTTYSNQPFPWLVYIARDHWHRWTVAAGQIQLHKVLLIYAPEFDRDVKSGICVMVSLFMSVALASKEPIFKDERLALRTFSLLTSGFLTSFFQLVWSGALFDNPAATHALLY